MQQKICFIGAGNLATHLSKALYNAGYSILQVYSRSKGSANLLAEQINAKATTKHSEIVRDADIYFVALKDSVVHHVLSEVDFQNKLIVHCSGSLSISILNNYSANIGVFYPLQTFTKNRRLDFKSIPVFVESNSKKNEELLTGIGSTISGSVSVLNSEKRKYLHISAVFACNFVNHFYYLSSELLKTKNISFDVLKPLILETARKVQELDPEDAQTGPAVRFDKNIINSHLEELRGIGNFEELYNSISKSIFEHHSKS